MDRIINWAQEDIKGLVWLVLEIEELFVLTKQAGNTGMRIYFNENQGEDYKGYKRFLVEF